MERFDDQGLLTDEELQVRADIQCLLQGLIDREEDTLRVVVFAMLSVGTPRFLERQVADVKLRRAAACLARVSRPVLVRLITKWMRKSLAQEIASYLVNQLGGAESSKEAVSGEPLVRHLPGGGSASVVAQTLMAKTKEFESERAANQIELSATRAFARRMFIVAVCAASLCVGSVALNAVFIARELMPPISLPERVSEN